MEATEERRPAHLHIAVLIEPGKVATLPQLVSVTVARRTEPAASAVRVSNPPSSSAAVTKSSSSRGSDAPVRARTYRVREGDTLWDVARRNGVSVNALARANNRSPRAVLRPGVTLRLPGSPSLR